MSYTNQIKVLASKLEQLEKLPMDKENIYKILQIQAQVKKLQRLEWEENYERVKLDDDR